MCGNGECGVHTSDSATQTPVAAISHPMEMCFSASGTAPTSSGSVNLPLSRYRRRSRLPSVGRLRTIPLTVTMRPWYFVCTLGLPFSSVNSCSADSSSGFSSGMSTQDCDLRHVALARFTRKRSVVGSPAMSTHSPTSGGASSFKSQRSTSPGVASSRWRPPHVARTLPVARLFPVADSSSGLMFRVDITSGTSNGSPGGWRSSFMPDMSGISRIRRRICREPLRWSTRCRTHIPETATSEPSTSARSGLPVRSMLSAAETLPRPEPTTRNTQDGSISSTKTSLTTPLTRT